MDANVGAHYLFLRLSFVRIFVAGDKQLQVLLAVSASGLDGQFDVTGLGPRKAMTALSKAVTSDEELLAWLQSARVNAIVGSCPKSLKSAKSGMRAWFWFYRVFLRRKGNAFPPAIDDLLAWSCVFRHPGTFSNYVSYVKLGCELVGVSTSVFKHPSLARAKKAVVKKQAFTARAPKFIHLSMVKQIVEHATASGDKAFAMLCLTAYAFLLRLPSEALPIVVHSRLTTENRERPLLTMVDGSIRLELRRRKNRLTPSVLVRSCWCKQCSATCPVHVLGAYVEALPAGAQPFGAYKPGSALAVLRKVLGELHIAEAGAYRTHDFRRGHADDLRRMGKSLREILMAGDWRSAAFLDYLDQVQLEADVIAEAHLADTSDEE